MSGHDLNKQLLLRYRALLRVVEPVREALMNIQDDIEDEGDRTYFGSTNHADQFKQIAQSLDDAKWAEVVTPLKSVAELNSWQLADDLIAVNKKAARLELANYDLLEALKAQEDLAALKLRDDETPEQAIARVRDMRRAAIAKAESRLTANRPKEQVG